MRAADLGDGHPVVEPGRQVQVAHVAGEAGRLRDRGHGGRAVHADGRRKHVARVVGAAVARRAGKAGLRKPNRVPSAC